MTEVENASVAAATMVAVRIMHLLHVYAAGQRFSQKCTLSTISRSRTSPPYRTFGEVFDSHEFPILDLLPGARVMGYEVLRRSRLREGMSRGFVGAIRRSVQRGFSDSM